MTSDSASLVAPLPPPAEGTGPAIWDLVIADMQERDRFGEQKYGKRLRAFNGRPPLVDLYQELLDAAVYAREEMEERAALEARLARAEAERDAALAEVTRLREELGLISAPSIAARAAKPRPFKAGLRVKRKLRDLGFTPEQIAAGAAAFPKPDEKPGPAFVAWMKARREEQRGGQKT